MTSSSSYDIERIRSIFPILHQEVNGKPLIYLDNAATTQKPQSVIDALTTYYSKDNANIHRGAHTLAARSTEYFEETRQAVAHFIGADDPATCIFTKGVTESINLVSQTWGRQHLLPGDEVLITGMEHHSNIVPWQMVCAERGARLRVIPVNENGELDLTDETLFNNRTRFLSCVWVSNALGTINPIETLIAKAKQLGIPVLLDGAQAGSHMPVNVKTLDCDFLTLSSHKLYGPTGVGLLYGKRDILESMSPYQGGGEMIKEVSFEGTTYNEIPYKFEAGTPNIGDVIAFKHALQFVNDIGKDAIALHEKSLLKHFLDGIDKINETYSDSIKLIGTATNKVAVQSMILNDIHHFDAGMMLDAMGIAVRTGHHCTQPLMKQFGIDGTVRFSFAAYNTIEEVDTTIQALTKIIGRKRK